VIQLRQATRKLALLGWRLHHFQVNELMKKALLAILAAGTTLFAVAPVFAATHHHPVCHKVHVHHHWERHCK
jgi:spore coat polysaccharide biosynthesis predicted glycosyltransferase SpsG